MADPASEPPLTASALGPAVFALLLLGGLLLGLAGIGGSAFLLVRDAQQLQALIDRGIVAPGERLQAVLVDSRAGHDGGCALGDAHLVRFEGAVVDRVSLADAVVVRDGEDVRVDGPAGALACYVGRGPEADAFVEAVRRRLRPPPAGALSR